VHNWCLSLSDLSAPGLYIIPYDDTPVEIGRYHTPREYISPVRGYKKVLVTGAAGFIGSHLSERLLSRGDDVVIVDELNDYYDVNLKKANLDMLFSRYGRDRVAFFRGDVSNLSLMEHVFESTNPKWVAHLAARAGVRPSIDDPFIYIHSNIEATTRLMDLSHKYKVSNFVFASSSSVYGGSQSRLFTETDQVDQPVSPYAATKKACELLAYTYHHLYGLNITALRFFTVYGPRGRPDMAPFKFVDRIIRGKKIQQFGDGSSSRDYTYIDDVVDGIVRSLDRPYPFEIFNIGKGSGISLANFVRLIEKYTGTKANVVHVSKQPGDVPYTCANVSKAKRLLGYKSTISVEEGVKRTVEWYREGIGSGGEHTEIETNITSSLSY